MSPADISALEWAIDELCSNAGLEQYEQLKELLFDAHGKARELCHDKRDLLAWMKRFAITIPQREFNQWRMARPEDQRVGEINGLEWSFRGVLRATDGIQCYVEPSNGDHPKLCHLQWFKPDAYQATPPTTRIGGRKVSKLDLALQAMMAGY